MKKRYYTVKHGTLRALQEFADKHNVEVRREGGSKALRMYRPDGKWRTVVDFKTNSVPQGVRDRAFEEWEQIIIDNALLLNADWQFCPELPGKIKQLSFVTKMLI